MKLKDFLVEAQKKVVIPSNEELSSSVPAGNMIITTYNYWGQVGLNGKKGKQGYIRVTTTKENQFGILVDSKKFKFKSDGSFAGANGSNSSFKKAREDAYKYSKEERNTWSNMADYDALSDEEREEHRAKGDVFWDNDNLKKRRKTTNESMMIEGRKYIIIETIDLNILLESVNIDLTGRTNAMMGIFGQLKPKQIIAINTQGEFTDVKDFNALKEELKYMITPIVIKKLHTMITNKNNNSSFDKYKDLELPKVIKDKDLNNPLLINAILDATESKLQIMASAAPKIPGELAA